MDSRLEYVQSNRGPEVDQIAKVHHATFNGYLVFKYDPASTASLASWMRLKTGSLWLKHLAIGKPGLRLRQSVFLWVMIPFCFPTTFAGNVSTEKRGNVTNISLR